MSAFALIEEVTREAVAWLRLVVEAMGALVIAVGIVVALVTTVRHLIGHQDASFNAVRLLLARYLLLALELQLAADILSTAIAPSWEQIGKLAAIAVIRTALSYFLTLETRHERARQEHDARS